MKFRQFSKNWGLFFTTLILAFSLVMFTKYAPSAFAAELKNDSPAKDMLVYNPVKNAEPLRREADARAILPVAAAYDRKF